MIDIIIPVYNTPSNDLKRCLDSIYNQKYKNYKVYIIDDGSNIETKDFLDNYIKDKENFLVKHIENGGVSNARNLGIKISSSDYLTFVDADDTIEENFLEDAYKLIKENNLDLIIGGYNEITNNKITKVRKCTEGLHIYDESNIELFQDKLLSAKIKEDNKEIASAPTGRIYSRLYKRKSLGNILFNLNIKISEDTLFMIDLISNIERVGLVSEVWYNYYQNDYSIVHQKDNDLEIIKFIDEIYKGMLNNNKPNLTNAYKIRIKKSINSLKDKELIDEKILNNIKEIDTSKYIG